MNNCPTFFSDPATIGSDCQPTAEPNSCSECCNCGYIQYESLFPYLSELKSLMKWDKENSDELEMRLRSEIIEISRLFDMQAGVKDGYFSKSHFQTTSTYTSNGSKYIKVPEHVSGTLEVRTTSNHVVAPSSYLYRDGYLIYRPCSVHSQCGCENSCSNSGCGSSCSRGDEENWTNSCYQVTAQWGKQCADSAVQRAVRDYLIEQYRVQDPIVVAATGLPITRTFKAPHSWTTYITSFRGKRDLWSKFAVA